MVWNLIFVNWNSHKKHVVTSELKRLLNKKKKMVYQKHVPSLKKFPAIGYLTISLWSIVVVI